jgi:hypothetical protein
VVAEVAAVFAGSGVGEAVDSLPTSWDALSSSGAGLGGCLEGLILAPRTGSVMVFSAGFFGAGALFTGGGVGFEGAGAGAGAGAAGGPSVLAGGPGSVTRSTT